MKEITAKDIQFLKDACDYIVKACTCNRRKGFDYGEKHEKLGIAPNGDRWLAPAERVVHMQHIIDRMEPADELEYCRHLLFQMADQNCGNDKNRHQTFFSGCIGVHAEVLRYLGQIGKLVVTSDNGGRVVGARRTALTIECAPGAGVAE